MVSHKRDYCTNIQLNLIMYFTLAKKKPGAPEAELQAQVHTPETEPAPHVYEKNMLEHYKEINRKLYMQIEQLEGELLLGT